MKLRDVPLGFLPTFEAAGRLGSFAAAAAELHLTPSAISQQIRALEDALGVALFERTGRAALLTCDGERYLSEVRQSLCELAASTARLQRRTQGTTLRLSTVSLVAHEFLLPRMAAFSARFPGLSLRIETSNTLVDFKVSDCDAALRLGGDAPELIAYRLGRVELAPVCAPALAREIREVADLCRFDLLDPDGVGQMQLGLLQQSCGAPQRTAAKVWSFETCFEALRAAEHGLGIAFAALPIVGHWVRSGRLAVPVPHRLPLPGHVCFVHRAGDDARFPFAEIAAWLGAQYSALPELPVGRISSADGARAAGGRSVTLP
jgi:LysR family glycine cleavage system transcriptional activator